MTNISGSQGLIPNDKKLIGGFKNPIGQISGWWLKHILKNDGVRQWEG